MFRLLFFSLSIGLYLPLIALAKQPTLEDQVAQTMVVHIEGSSLTDEHRAFFSRVPVGGVILYSWANDLHSSAQTKAFCKSIKVYFRQIQQPEPWIMVDEEGGDVFRLHFGDRAPSQKEVASEQSPYMAYKTAEKIAKKLKEHAIDVNLSPVVDIPSASDFPFKKRAFSDRHKVVSAYAKSYQKAYHDNGVLNCLKHFPGHGGASLDSHYELPFLTVDESALSASDWQPYFNCAKEADFVMTAHLIVPSIDELPATISYALVTNKLKNVIGYQGLVITDSLVMKGILSYEADFSELAYRAFKAGHHLLLFGGAELHDGIPQDALSTQELQRIHKELVKRFEKSLDDQKLLYKTYQKIVTKKKVL